MNKRNHGLTCGVRKVGSCCDVVLVDESAKAIATLDALWGAKNSVLPAKSLICRARIEFGTPQASRLREAQADLTPARVMSTLPVEAGSEAVTTRLPIEASRFHGAPSRIHSGCFSPNRAVCPW
jgi:hypothetical protein